MNNLNYWILTKFIIISFLGIIKVHCAANDRLSWFIKKNKKKPFSVTYKSLEWILRCSKYDYHQIGLEALLYYKLKWYGNNDYDHINSLKHLTLVSLFRLSAYNVPVYTTYYDHTSWYFSWSERERDGIIVYHSLISFAIRTKVMLLEHNTL